MLKHLFVLSVTFNVLFGSNYEADSGAASVNLKTADGSVKTQDSFLDLQRQDQGRKGHHDLENRKKVYTEDDGRSNKYNHKDGYFGGFLNTNQDRQGYDFNQTGSYAKGHKTGGRHNVHKIDELKKDTDFFDNDFDAFGQERHGGYERQKAILKGNFGLHGSTEDAFSDRNKKIQDFLEQKRELFKELGFNKLFAKNDFAKKFNVFDVNKQTREDDT